MEVKSEPDANEPQLGSSPTLAAAPRALLPAARKPRRRALLIGINYIGQPAQLSGCVNDIADVRAVCTDLRYDEVCILHDGVWPGKFNKADARIGPDLRPTHKNITAAMSWLVKDAAAGDILWFHYSGHGGQLQALIAGAEPDGLDETIVPVDYEVSGQIRDEDIKKMLVDPIRGTRASLRAVLDSCHSGTGIDLKYNLVDATALRAVEAGAAPAARDVSAPSDIPESKSRRIGPEPPGPTPPGMMDSVAAVNAFKRGNGAAIIAALVIPLIPSGGDRALAVELAGPETLIEWSAAVLGGAATRRTVLGGAFAERPTARGFGPVEVCLVSGCADPQTSADATFNRRPGGALTHCLVEYLRTCYRASSLGVQATWPTAVDLLRNVRRKIRAGGFEQVPQFSSEEPITPALRFNLL